MASELPTECVLDDARWHTALPSSDLHEQAACRNVHRGPHSLPLSTCQLQMSRQFRRRLLQVGFLGFRGLKRVPLLST